MSNCLHNQKWKKLPLRVFLGKQKLFAFVLFWKSPNEWEGGQKLSKKVYNFRKM